MLVVWDFKKENIASNQGWTLYKIRKNDQSEITLSASKLSIE